MEQPQDAAQPLTGAYDDRPAWPRREPPPPPVPLLDLRVVLELDEPTWTRLRHVAEERVMKGRPQLQEAHFRLVDLDVEPVWYELPREESQQAFKTSLKQHPVTREERSPVSFAMDFIADCLATRSQYARTPKLGDLETRSDKTAQGDAEGEPGEGTGYAGRACILRWPELLAFDFHAIAVLHGLYERFGLHKAVIGWFLDVNSHPKGWYPLTPLFLAGEAMAQAIIHQRLLAVTYLDKTKLVPELADPCHWWPNLLLPLELFEERLAIARQRLIEKKADPLQVLAALRAPR